MSYEVKNGHLVSTKPMSRGVSAPTPGQIAERAYDLAVDVACSDDAMTSDQSNVLRASMNEKKSRTLAALRDSVINPPVVPWWKKP